MKSTLAAMRTCIACLALVACGRRDDTQAKPEPEPPPVAEPNPAAKLEVTSTAFSANAEIPQDHTCEGADAAPPLAWSGAPDGTKSFALIVDDPDAPDPAAPKRTWVHWVLASIPGNVTSLPGGQPPAGIAVGTNDWGKQAWGGPCPPIGRHRYFFKVYALDAAIGSPGLKKAELLALMHGHVLARGELIGTYQKKK
jgi:hypothetical protein